MTFKCNFLALDGAIAGDRVKTKEIVVTAVGGVNVA
jgi:hypothetical protein